MAGDRSSNVLLTDRDSPAIYSVRMSNGTNMCISAASGAPRFYPLYDRMTAADLIFLGSFTRVRHAFKETRPTISIGQVTIDYGQFE